MCDRRASSSGRVVERFEELHVGEILGPPCGALHLEQIAPVGDGDRQLAERDLVGAGSHVGERSEVRRQCEEVEWPVGSDEMPLIARCEQRRVWHRL
jgi:hypothetical protein